MPGSFQLVMFFEDLRSERRLMRVVADRLSVRRYLGYDLFELLPDHSSLIRIRERYGLLAFRRFFKRMVELCLEAGLVQGKELFFDATKARANADVDGLRSRSLVEGHLDGFFEEETQQSDAAYPPEPDAAAPPAARDELAEANARRGDWVFRDGAQDRSFESGSRKEDRPELGAAMDFCREGDELVVRKLDRFDRSLKELVEPVGGLRERGVEFVSLRESIDTTTPGGKLVFHAFGAVAGFERDPILGRTAAGLGTARFPVVHDGPAPDRAPPGPRRPKPMRDREAPMSGVCGAVGVSRARLHRYLAPDGIAQRPRAERKSPEAL